MALLVLPIGCAARPAPEGTGPSAPHEPIVVTPVPDASAATTASSAAAVRDDPGWGWEAHEPANAEASPILYFGSGGCVFFNQRVSCEPGIDQHDFEKWSVPLPGETIAYRASGDRFYVVVVGSGGPLLLAVDSAKAREVWRTPVPSLRERGASSEKRRVQVRVEGNLVVVRADEGRRSVEAFDAGTGAARPPEPR